MLVDALGKFSDPGCCNDKSFKDDLAKAVKPPNKEQQVLDVAFSSKGAFVVFDSPEQEQCLLDPMAKMSESNSTIVVLGCKNPTGLDSSVKGLDQVMGKSVVQIIPEIDKIEGLPNEGQGGTAVPGVQKREGNQTRSDD